MGKQEGEKVTCYLFHHYSFMKSFLVSMQTVTSLMYNVLLGVNSHILFLLYFLEFLSTQFNHYPANVFSEQKMDYYFSILTCFLLVVAR